MNNPDDELIETIANFSLDPLGHALYSYPWLEDDTELAGVEAPREWQCDILKTIGTHLQNPNTRFQPLRLAVSSGHGIGKSALIGMISKWAIDTCDNARVVITANTDGQLRTKTSPEVSKWHNLAITSHWFEVETTSIHARGQQAKNWRLDFVPWSEQNTEAFAGLHNKGKRIVLVYDEGSAISDRIWEVSEGALTDSDTEIIWIVFGNPTRAIGRFRECWRKFSKLWHTWRIDSRDVIGTNLKLFAEWAQSYGEDSNFFRMRVRGEFPNQSAKQFYPSDLIEAAKKRCLTRQDFSFAPTILTVDPSWEGDDDFIIALRQGLNFRVLRRYEKNSNDLEMGGIIARLEDEHEADAVFIDAGYGTGIVSFGRTMNRNWNIVWFAEKSGRLDCVNKRAEMLVEILQWLKDGGSIPEDDEELYEELMALETVATLDGKFKFPPKETIKEIIGRSPNRLDALGLSFAYPVAPKAKSSDLTAMAALHGRKKKRDYNPLDEFDKP